jgi:hypothetical protein
MRRMLGLLAPGLIVTLMGCANDDPAPVDPMAYAYRDWLYHPYGWYDDPFWIWVDDNPGCCATGDDLKDALDDWWDDLDPDEQDQVREQADSWLEDHGLEPAAGENRRDLILDTAAERWEALSPEERSSWLAERQERIAERRAIADQLSPEQRAAIEDRVQSLTPEQREAARTRLGDVSPSRAAAVSDRVAGAEFAGRTPDRVRDSHRFQYRMTNHPIPARSQIRATPRFRAAGGRGGGGRGRR